ncbi:MAG: DUF2949 domain-containing protein [Scytonema sp. PMC 1069.18]|nr:DUF2949 domain-containing protein [Scytonema sp. PMC 1069.18]MEC4887685.1 DUF2949 domain-containing protein [Scytonema sp. PMC 1070.18]
MTIQSHDMELIDFLHNELLLPFGDIEIALRKHQFNQEPLAMLLWQYGLVNLDQLERLLDWQENQF